MITIRAIGTTSAQQETPPAMYATINDIVCDTTQAEWIYASPAGSDCFVPDGFRRFDEVLYRGQDGYWFLVRPLAPDEAREWLENWRHDSLLARQIFPDRDQGRLDDIAPELAGSATPQLPVDPAV